MNAESFISGIGSHNVWFYVDDASSLKHLGTITRVGNRFFWIHLKDEVTLDEALAEIGSLCAQNNTREKEA